MNSTRPTPQQWLSESIRLLWQLMRTEMVLLLTLFTISCGTNLMIEDAMQLNGTMTKDPRWELQILLGLIDFVEGLLMLLLLSRGAARVRSLTSPEFVQNPFAHFEFKTFISEYLRMLAQILIFGLLLIIPGFIRYVQLVFVPMIVLFSARYSRGEIDALKASKALTKNQWGRVLFAIVLTLALTLLFEFAPHILEIDGSHVLRVLSQGLSYLTGIWAFSLIFLLFEYQLPHLKLEEK